MSNIPTCRSDLLLLINKHYSKLSDELKSLETKHALLACEKDFSIKDIIAIRLWWTLAVIRWIEQGKKGEEPDIPAKGYSLQKMQPLHEMIARESQQTVMHSLIADLQNAVERLVATIDSLSDDELTIVGQFAWAKRWPVMRWISIGTSSQYQSARSLIRKALKNADA